MNNLINAIYIHNIYIYLYPVYTHLSIIKICILFIFCISHTTILIHLNFNFIHLIK